MASDYNPPHTTSKLVRNGRVDAPNDYTYIFLKLQLREDFQQEFFEIMKEYRSQDDVREVLEDPENDLKEISEDFLNAYGKKIWMLKGVNNKQDLKYRETFFKWKDDQDNFGGLWRLLDELWTRVRQLLWDQGSESTLSTQGSPSLRSRESSSTISSMDAEEEAIAVQFINKVRVQAGLAGDVRPRKHLIKSIEED